MRTIFNDFLCCMKLLCLTFIHLIPFVALFFSAYWLVKTIPKYENHYIDMNNNEGIASFCNRDMSCVVNGHRILVKEYWKVEVENDR